MSGSSGDPMIRQYRIIRQLGRGANSTVYLAWHTDLDKRVVLKRLEHFEADDPAIAARFGQEAKLAASFDHPNIVTIYDYFVEGDDAWLVMEYFRLGPTRRLLGHLTVPEMIVMLQETLWGLSAMGTAGVVHRDLKPENLLRSDRGSVKISDFGISRRIDDPDRLLLTRRGDWVGTPEYAAPEVIVGDDATPASDLYAVGTIAFEFLSGRRPYSGARSPAELIEWKRDRRAPPLASRTPDLDVRVCVWVDQLLRRQPERRFSDAPAAIHALQDAAEAAYGIDWAKAVRLPASEGPARNEEPAPVPPTGFGSLDELRTEATIPQLLRHAALNPWGIGLGIALVAAGFWRDREWAIVAGIALYLVLGALTFFDRSEARRARSGRHRRSALLRRRRSTS